MPDDSAPLPRLLRPLFLIVDLGSIAYWAITLAGLIQSESLFKEHDDPILPARSWWFLPFCPLRFLPDLVQDSNKELRMDAPGGRH